MSQNNDKDPLEDILKEINIDNLDNRIKDNLGNYISINFRILSSYRNVKQTYLIFNFLTLLIYISFFGIWFIYKHISFLLDPWRSLDFLLVVIGAPFIVYFLYLCRVLLLISNSLNLSYPNPRDFKRIKSNDFEFTNTFYNHFKNFLNQNEEDLIKTEIRTLIKLEFYQNNYQKIIEKLKFALILGILCFSASILLSAFL